MSGETNFRSDLEPRRGDNVVLDRHVDNRLKLSRQDWATLPEDAIRLLAPLLNRDLDSWEPGDVQAIIASLERANGTGEAAAMLARIRHGTTVERDLRRDWQQPISELRQLYDDQASDRRRPTSATHTFARRMAELRVDGEKRRAGLAAMEEEKERWSVNPGDPRAPGEIQAARDLAEREVEQRRPSLITTKTAEIESEKVKKDNDRFRNRSGQITNLEKMLKENGVPLPPKPRELTS